ncbi:hypothetical protein B0O99DRAFT_688110 [Bisporella sp. PMI_857]|nr:hypothetical protein B0O99DRAFT_688110 [Bisporella sp. PMI_857]
MESTPVYQDSPTSSARSSYSSVFSRPLHVSRSSFGSISEVDGSSKPSESTRFNWLERKSSFSRRPPPLVTSVARRSRGNSLARQLKEATEAEPGEAKQGSENNLRSGTTVLSELKDVKEIICVAFGAFDRFYIGWEDLTGIYHQERQNLPEKLEKWLFSSTGETRHIPTLQVSFGSQDEFYASDRDGKLSNRETASPQISSENEFVETQHTARKKAHSISSPGLPPDPANNFHAPKLERRRTDLITRREFKGRSPTREKRRSIIVEGVSFEQPQKQAPLAQRYIDIFPRPGYVDACVQTEITWLESERCFNQEPQAYDLHSSFDSEMQSSIHIGTMQDFCRMGDLGDALGFV